MWKYAAAYPCVANEHSEPTGMHNAAKQQGLHYFVRSVQTRNKPNDEDRARAPAQARPFGRVQRVDAVVLGEGSHKPRRSARKAGRDGAVHDTGV